MLKISFIICALFFSASVFAENTCRNDEIGKQINLKLPVKNQGLVTKTFVVKSCEDSVYTALEFPNGSTQLRYKDQNNNIRRIEFINTDSSSEFHPAAQGTWDLQKNELTFDQPSTNALCPPGQHPDPSMGGMCMPDDCPPGQHWDQKMGMCMPGSSVGSTTTMFHYNQFLIYTKEQGPRGRDAFSGPNMWMLMINKQTSDNNQIGLSWMGTTDLWTVPAAGTPELLQTGESNKNGVPYIDAQHPHSSPIMGLTFSDILTLGENGQHKLTFFFAPRGEATAGPEAFMHRASADGNPDAPLSHHLQDVFHITSTVIGTKLEIDSKTTIEASVFSGREPSPAEVNLDMHKPDSFGVRMSRVITDNVSVGGSYAKVTAQDREGSTSQEHEAATSAWITTSNAIKGGQFDNSMIWGQVRNREQSLTLNSYLEEFVYQLGKNNFFGRAEVLQRTPGQLEIQVTDGATGAKWVKALTFGYERNIFERKNMKVYAGAAVTKDFVPKEFKLAYGGNPITVKAFLRVTGREGQ